MLNYLKWILALSLDTMGEVESAESQGGASEVSLEEGQDKTSANVQETGENGSSKQASTTPKYGEFGDSPSVDDVFKKVKEYESQLAVIKGQSAQTEKNLSMTRNTLKNLESQGFKILYDSSGQPHVQKIEEQPKALKQSRFTDEHKQLFEPDILAAIELRAQDLFDNLYEEKESQRKNYLKEQETNRAIHGSAVKQMYTLFPTLKDDSPNVNTAFRQKAEQYLNERYRNDPRGDLLAALDAATEMGIMAMGTATAKAAGYEQAKQEKKVLGAVSGNSAGQSKSQKKLSKEEYFSLSEEKRDEYDKASIQK